MSVIINMEMPKRCFDCRLYTYEYGCMLATADVERLVSRDCKEDRISYEEASYRRCPLRPLPEKDDRWEQVMFDDGHGLYFLYEHKKCGCIMAKKRNYCPDCGAPMI